MNNVYDAIAKKITDLRNNYGGTGLTQDELAKKMNTTANTISRWEKAVYRPSAEDLHKLAQVFGVSISVFFPDMDLSDRHRALLSATGELGPKDMDDLIEYARFRKARAILANEKRPRKKSTDK